MAEGGLRPAGRHGDLPLPGSRMVLTAVGRANTRARTRRTLIHAGLHRETRAVCASSKSSGDIIQGCAERPETPHGRGLQGQELGKASSGRESTPSGIRTRDLRLERATSWAARLWGPLEKAQGREASFTCPDR